MQASHIKRLNLESSFSFLSSLACTDNTLSVSDISSSCIEPTYEYISLWFHVKHHITITCLPSNQKISTPRGSNIFQALRAAKVQIAYACDGEGICAQCTLKIEPKEHISIESRMEKKRKKDNRISEALRISCLCRAFEDITVFASYW